MQSRLLDQQQHRDRGQRRRQPQLAEAAEHPGAKHDERGHFGGAIDVARARADVAGHDQRHRAGDDQAGGQREVVACQPARRAGDDAEQRERADAAEPRVGPGRVAGSLPLDADRGAAENGDDHAGRLRQAGSMSGRPVRGISLDRYVAPLAAAG